MNSDVDFIGIVAFIDIDFEVLDAFGKLGASVCRGQPEGVVGAGRSSVAVATFEIAVFETTLGPETGAGPVLSAALFLAIDQVENTVFHAGVLTPTAAEDVAT